MTRGSRRKLLRFNVTLFVRLGVALILSGFLYVNFVTTKQTHQPTNHVDEFLNDGKMQSTVSEPLDHPPQGDPTSNKPYTGSLYSLPLGLKSLLDRAKQMKGICNTINPLAKATLNEIDLPSLGVIDDLSSYRPKDEQEFQNWQCTLPPSQSCHLEKFSVIFLGFNPNRLGDVKRQMRTMMQRPQYREMIEEIILVWNNPEPINKTAIGSELYQRSLRNHTEFDVNSPNIFRIFYPVELGFSSSLINRYHPMIKPKSKALLYYDDDGPFYDVRAIISAFELWKRNSDAQLGAMARAFTLSQRQREEKVKVVGPDDLNDRKFVSHCRDQGDQIGYDYRHFENFHANMVLPSGSFMHRNYLCFIWHPALANLRRFVEDHLVHPDDMAVSTIVSHVSGRAPLTYSRRLPGQPKDEKNKKRRRLTEQSGNATEGMWRTADWGRLRTIALNSVISYFGGINSGSFGWCYKTKYQKRIRDKVRGQRHVCEPEIARDFMVPWLEMGGYRNDMCPTTRSINF